MGRSEHVTVTYIIETPHFTYRNYSKKILLKAPLDKQQWSTITKHETKSESDDKIALCSYPICALRLYMFSMFCSDLILNEILFSPFIT